MFYEKTQLAKPNPKPIVIINTSTELSLSTRPNVSLNQSNTQTLMVTTHF